MHIIPLQIISISMSLTEIKLIALLQAISMVLSLTATLLDTRQKVIARPLGILSSATGFVVYFNTGLYAKCMLNIFYIFLNIYGWYQWLYGGRQKTPLQITNIAPQSLPILFFIGTAGGLFWGIILDYFFQARLAHGDAVHTVFCIIAQWMLARKKLECWYLWVALDFYYTGVCIQTGLYLFAAQHVLYIALGIYGYYSWKGAYLQQAKANDQGTALK